MTIEEITQAIEKIETISYFKDQIDDDSQEEYQRLIEELWNMGEYNPLDEVLKKLQKIEMMLDEVLNTNQTKTNKK